MGLSLSSGLGRLQVDDAGVSVQEPVERTVSKGGGKNAPHAHDEEHHFELNVGQKIEDEHDRTKDSSGRSLSPSDVSHAPKCSILTLKRLFGRAPDASTSVKDPSLSSMK